MSNENMIRTGLYLPKDALKRIDERKGRYYSRNKYVLKVLEERWDEEDHQLKNLQGPTVSHQAQAVPPTTTNPHAGTLEVDSLETHGNHEGSRRRG
jgi:hypothetical protein